MKPARSIIYALSMAVLVASRTSAEEAQVSFGLSPSEVANRLRTSIFLAKEGNEPELIHVDEIGKSTANMGSTIKYLLAYLVISESEVAYVFIEQEGVVTGAKFMLLRKQQDKWNVVESRKLFEKQAPPVVVMSVPNRSKSPITIEKNGNTKLLVKYEMGEGIVKTEEISRQFDLEFHYLSFDKFLPCCRLDLPNAGSGKRRYYTATIDEPGNTLSFVDSGHGLFFSITNAAGGVYVYLHPSKSLTITNPQTG